MNFKAKALDTFWYWINERQAIYNRRLEGAAWPWTTDPILQEYRFCNVYRMQDTETINLHKALRKGADMEDILFNVILFRTFNWTPTYVALGGWQKRVDFNPREAKKILKVRKADKQKIITGAYMITNGGKPGVKSDMLVDAVTAASKVVRPMSQELYDMHSMKHAVKTMRSLPFVGDFVAYEFACDLRFTKVLEKADDVTTYANPGPGAKRGINRLLGRPHGRPYLSPEELQDAMHTLWCMAGSESFLNADQSKWPFELREIEHSLCEFDKYTRVKNGEGRPRSRYAKP